MSRYPADDPLALLRDHTMVGEMGRLNEVAVGRITIERRAARNKRRYGRSVRGNGRSERNFGGGSGGRWDARFFF